MAKPFTKKGWRNFKIIAGGVDGIQIAVDLIPVYGEIINAIADIVIGIAFALIYWRKKAITPQAAVALIISFFGEEGSLSAAPLWVLDVWYTQRSAPPNPEELASLEAIYLDQNNSNVPLNQNNVRLPDNADKTPLNMSKNGKNIRPPSNPTGNL